MSDRPLPDPAAVRALLEAPGPPAQAPGRSRLCLGLVCVLHGARRLLEDASRGEAGPRGMPDRVEITDCLGYCYASPVLVDENGGVHTLASDGTLRVGSALVTGQALGTGANEGRDLETD